MAPPGYDPDAVSALRDAAATIRGLVETAQMMDDRDEQVPSDLLMTLYTLLEPLKHLIPEGHGLAYILPRLQMPGQPKRPDPTWKIVIVYGPTMANLIYERANQIERTSYGAETSRSPQVTVYVDPKDRPRHRHQQTPRPRGNAG